MKVLITRAEPAASQTARTLQENGHEAILMPLFKVTDTGVEISETSYDGIIFTSRNAVETLQKRGWTNVSMEIPAFCVGEKTEQAAQAMGFSNTITANGGGRVLCDTMSTMNLKRQHFLYPSTPDKSFDMASALESQGIKVDTADIYRTKTITPTPEAIGILIKTLVGNCIFSYSALSSKHLASIFSNQPFDIIKTITLIGISSQAIKPLVFLPWKSVLIAQSPNEQSMMKLIPQDGL